MKIREGCLRRLRISSASSQAASPIRQREEPFVSEISFSNHPLSLSFRHASLMSLPIRCYSKAQATTAPNLSGHYQPIIRCYLAQLDIGASVSRYPHSGGSH